MCTLSNNYEITIIKFIHSESLLIAKQPFFIKNKDNIFHKVDKMITNIKNIGTPKSQPSTIPAIPPPVMSPSSKLILWFCGTTKVENKLKIIKILLKLVLLH